ncbi:unnamed protein product [Parascedosporium putredinis]|uniref:Xylanolytic transcriptional activator regulatory domain-containing protein n=1 Tax=Parascedosporium putredinis TaxID=1442378 RepID=A0A9P1MEH3_9PEZI|nr:unnamed protein product [Parascedosporium putredinis]CAI8002761.1 unnamed protein product [Parascedosporium putredinis]
MGDQGTTRLAYAEAMKHHGCGFGFLETESLKRVHRGMCGYLDPDGCWHPIADLTDTTALEEDGYDRPARLIPGERSKAEWGARTAQGTRMGSAALAAGGGGMGIGAKVEVSITCARESGAVVLCNSPVFMECFDSRPAFRKWAKENAERILEQCDDVKDLGFHIVEATWVSDDVYLNALRSFAGLKWVSESRGDDEEETIIVDPDDETKAYVLEGNYQLRSLQTQENKGICRKPDAGAPCDYCRSINQECSFGDSRRHQRPFCFVSEEEYQLLKKLCTKSFPGQDLSVASLRRLVARPDDTASPDSVFPHTPATLPRSEYAVAATGSESAGSLRDGRRDAHLQEIADLHHDLGCLVLDAQGEHRKFPARYVGPDSGHSFNISVRSWLLNVPSQTEKEVLSPMLTVSMPTATSLSDQGVTSPDPQVLPSHEVVLACASRYFEEVHSMYWIYSAEEFHTRLETTYAYPDRPNSGSWLASLHSIVALGAASIPALEGLSNGELARDSLEAAKQLVSSICDQGDLDGLRAFILLVRHGYKVITPLESSPINALFKALALQYHGYLNQSYLYVGNATRIAFSLGLHVDKYTAKHNVVLKTHGRRIWWNLFLIDHDISLQLGQPSMSGPTCTLWKPPLPSEEIISPGSFTPPEYLGHCVDLAQLVQEIRHNLYTRPMRGDHQLRESDFADSLKSLQTWLDRLPRHLHVTPAIPPFYRRLISLLHLRYWSAVMLVTRPFLLCQLLRGERVASSRKRQRFDQLARTCISAAESSLGIFEDMAQHKVASSLVMMDFFSLSRSFRLYSSRRPFILRQVGLTKEPPTERIDRALLADTDWPFLTGLDFGDIALEEDIIEQLMQIPED